MNIEYTKGEKMANTNEKETAAKNVKADIASLMGFIECELDKRQGDLNWAQIGDLQHLRKNLLEALSAFSGISEEAINETLEDARL